MPYNATPLPFTPQFPPTHQFPPTQQLSTSQQLTLTPPAQQNIPPPPEQTLPPPPERNLPPPPEQSLPPVAPSSYSSQQAVQPSSNIAECKAKVFYVKKCVLPPIDKTKLSKPEEVRAKYTHLINDRKITRFAVRLAQEAFFGKPVMAACTMKGTKEYHAIPAAELAQLKDFLYEIAVPAIYQKRSSWEEAWKDCWDSIGQSCKNLRGL